MSVAVEHDDRALCRALRAGDERAFEELVERYHGRLRRFALTYVQSAAAADEVVQDTWVAVIRGIERFEGRSSLKTWIFQILVNNAITRAQRVGRPFALPRRAPRPLAGTLGGAREPVERAARGRAARSRDAGRPVGRDCRTAGDAAARDHAS
jgi:RNA polymerase sigma factor (sigma-70 family)